MIDFYNEIDPYAAQWIRNLIAAGHLPAGVVDERSIEDIRPDELMGYRQCHFFAGIGVWSYALRLAGWPDDRQIWTGSCPCQPFSAAGKGKGFSDQRHLWPAWFYLIEQCRPAIVLGEQVASKDGLQWLDLVHTDMETSGYAFAAVDLCAAGVGAPHIRQRLWFVGHAEHTRLEGLAGNVNHPQGRANPDGSTTKASSIDGHWGGAEWRMCSDRVKRPIEPGIAPLVDGDATVVGRLRAYGNCINAQAARTFIEAAMPDLIRPKIPI